VRGPSSRPPGGLALSLLLGLALSLLAGGLVLAGLAGGLLAGTDRGEHPIDEIKEPAHIVVIQAIAQLNGTEPRQLLEPGRQFLLAHRPGAIDQHRDHPHPTLQRRLDLEPHKVTGIVQPPVALLIG
jgi:hypothetical protein